jgi:glycosyltransferase involved in cell wall biosynthesis
VLTVFIPTHNGGPDLARVLSAYTSLRPPSGGWKLVVIDNASDDDSLRVARSFSDRLPLLCLSEPTRGKNRALNSALWALDGDLAVFADDDGLPDPAWLVQFRNVADASPDFDGFGGSITPLWSETPADWILQWVHHGPVYGVTEGTVTEGPCDASRIWGPNMAIRAAHFHKGHRFDEHIGPDGSPTYAMGSETEFTIRLSFAENARFWHCAAARMKHIVRPEAMRPGWILKRAFRLGRCAYRESRQRLAAGCDAPQRDPDTTKARLEQALARLSLARASVNPRRLFEARWEVNFCAGCLYEAATSHAEPAPIDACLEY